MKCHGIINNWQTKQVNTSPESGFGGRDDADSIGIHFLTAVTHALRQLIDQILDLIIWILICVRELLWIQ